MTYLLNLLGTFLNATNCLLTAMILAYILTKQGMAQRKFLWIGLCYTVLQAFTASTVWLNLYIGHFEMLTAVLRVLFSLVGGVIPVSLAVHTFDIIRTLRKAKDEEVRLQDERSNLMMAVEVINRVFDNANESSRRHSATLARQGAG